MFEKVRTTFSPKRMKRIGRGTLLGILIGIVSGLGAIVFNFLLQTGSKFFMNDLINLALPGGTSSYLFFRHSHEEVAVAYNSGPGWSSVRIDCLQPCPGSKRTCKDALIDASIGRKVS